MPYIEEGRFMSGSQALAIDYLKDGSRSLPSALMEGIDSLLSKPCGRRVTTSPTLAKRRVGERSSLRKVRAFCTDLNSGCRTIQGQQLDPSSYGPITGA